jgi:TPP-dependent pyruvate/acetoin dehydrogenase alpha subunit
MSQDRTPGLGFEAVEPAGWENMFCEHEGREAVEVADTKMASEENHDRIFPSFGQHSNVIIL